MDDAIVYRFALPADVYKLSILYKQVYIHTYGREGVSDEFANFIIRQFNPDRLSAILNKNENSIIVAEYKSNLVGVAEIVFNAVSPVGNITAPELGKLYILDWFCGKGIGRSLLQQAEQTVAENNQSKIWLWVLETNLRAIDFYKSNGYIETGTASFKMETNTYVNIVMVKDL